MDRGAANATIDKEADWSPIEARAHQMAMPSFVHHQNSIKLNL